MAILACPSIVCTARKSPDFDKTLVAKVCLSECGVTFFSPAIWYKLARITWTDLGESAFKALLLFAFWLDFGGCWRVFWPFGSILLDFDSLA